MRWLARKGADIVLKALAEGDRGLPRQRRLGASICIHLLTRHLSGFVRQPFLSRTAGFQLNWIWYLSVVAMLIQLALSMLLLRREFSRRLAFPSQPKLDNTAVATAMVAVE